MAYASRFAWLTNPIFERSDRFIKLTSGVLGICFISVWWSGGNGVMFWV